MCGHNNSGCLIESDDPSGPGVSLGSGCYTYAEPCKCVAKGECPWCGEHLVGDSKDNSDDGDFRCSDEESCGWTWLRAMELAQEFNEPDYD